jgi:DNA-binding GntR family transcriptional regulator
MERSYATLRSMLRAGAFAPGARLEAARLADEINVSATPIRDALHQLAGERLVDATIGEGFRVPRLNESELRELYEWQSAILTMAVRTTTPVAQALATRQPSVGATLADRTAELFERLAAAAPNRELRVAILAADARIHPFRIYEEAVIRATEAELDDVARIDPAQPQALRRYHMRRMRAATDLVRARENGPSGGLENN